MFLTKNDEKERGAERESEWTELAAKINRQRDQN